MITHVLASYVLVAALLRGWRVTRQVLRACLTHEYLPAINPALLAECEDVLGRKELPDGSALTAKERGEVLDGLLRRRCWVEVYYGWRPNLPDEADNYLIELAVAARADAIVTRKLKDSGTSELSFLALKILTPEQCLKEYPCRG